MLGEGFVLMLHYREEDIWASSSPSADCVLESYTFPPMKGTQSSLKSGSDTRPGQKAPHHRPGLYISNHEEKPYISLSQPDESDTKLTNQSLDLQLSSITEVHHLSTKPKQWYILQLSNFIPASAPFKQDDIHDDGYLVMDSSIMFNGEPPTNSMLNGYLDRKFQEVYSQYLQERLACTGCSAACSLLLPFHQTSLIHRSQSLNMDSSLEPDTRGSQGAVSRQASSTFSSPVLHISNAEEPIRPRHSAYL